MTLPDIQRGIRLHAAGVVQSDGTLTTNTNIESVVRGGIGFYQVTLATPIPTSERHVTASAIRDGDDPGIYAVDSNDDTVVNIVWSNSGGNAIDTLFSFAVLRITNPGEGG